jgi:MoaA/NifB/PqqE/SkfB family radical SAM enzyme
MLLSNQEKMAFARCVFGGFRIGLPESVTVAISSKCVNKCIFCPTNGICISEEDFKINNDPLVGKFRTEWLRSNINQIEKMKAEQPFMELGAYKRIISELARAGVKSVWLIGFGEPLLHPKAKEMIRYAVKKIQNVGVTTNGDLLDEKWIDFFRKNSVHLGISVDSFDQESRKLIHGEPTSDFNRILELVSDGTKKNPPLRATASFVLNKKNFPGIEEFLKRSKSAGFTGIGLYRLTTIPQTAKLQLSVREYQEAEKIVQNFANSNPRIKVDFPFPADSLKKDFSIPCFEPMRFLIINSDGSTFGCNRGYRNLGNVIDSSVEKVWNSWEFRKFRKDAFYKIPKKQSSLSESACYDCGATNATNREIFEWGINKFGWSRARFTIKKCQKVLHNLVKKKTD